MRRLPTQYNAPFSFPPSCAVHKSSTISNPFLRRSLSPMNFLCAFLYKYPNPLCSFTPFVPSFLPSLLPSSLTTYPVVISLLYNGWIWLWRRSGAAVSLYLFCLFVSFFRCYRESSSYLLQHAAKSPLLQILKIRLIMMVGGGK